MKRSFSAQSGYSETKDSTDEDSSREKNEVLEEIRELNHIGRTANDIERTLLAKGYDAQLLSEILTASFVESLSAKEEGYTQLRRAERAEQEASRQKDLQEA